MGKEGLFNQKCKYAHHPIEQLMKYLCLLTETEKPNL